MLDNIPEQWTTSRNSGQDPGMLDNIPESIPRDAEATLAIAGNVTSSS